MDIKTVVRLFRHGKRPSRRPIRPAKPSYRAEAFYREKLLEIVAELRKAGERFLLPVLKRTEPEYARKTAADGLVRDGFAYDILAAFDAMASALGGIDRVAARLAAEAVERQRQEADRQLSLNLSKGLGVDMSSAVAALNVGPQIETAIAANAELIKSLPAQAIEKIKGRVLNDVSKGVRYESLAEEIERQFGVAESRAKLIARDQMAKANAAITEAKQRAVGVSKYRWVTAGDERVRADHAERDGEVFSWDAPPPDGHPGEPINCRCIAVPVMEFDE